MFSSSRPPGYISSGDAEKATGYHFNLPGNSLAGLRVTAIEHTTGRSHAYRKERKHYLIRRFDTFYNGMNKQN